MYLIVILLLQTDTYKTISDPTLYTSMYECETARAVVNSKLMLSRPTESAAVFSQCTELSIKDQAVSGINL